MSDQPKKSNFFEKLATFIVDKRNLIFFLYAIAIIASLITQSWVKVSACATTLQSICRRPRRPAEA